MQGVFHCLRIFSFLSFFHEVADKSHLFQVLLALLAWPLAATSVAVTIADIDSILRVAMQLFEAIRVWPLSVLHEKLADHRATDLKAQNASRH